MRTLAAMSAGRPARLVDETGGVEAVRATLRARLGVADVADEAEVLARACAEEAFDRDALRRAADALAAGAKTDKDRAATLYAWLEAPDDPPVSRTGTPMRTSS